MAAHLGRVAMLLVAGGLALSLIAGCSSSAPSAEAQLCDSVTELESAASELGTLSLASTRAQVQQSVDGFLVALESVAGDLAGVVEADVDAVQESFDNLSSELESLPETASIGAAVAAVQQAIPAMQAALDQVLSGVDCEGTALEGDGS